jgi:hypothetical protein
MRVFSALLALFIAVMLVGCAKKSPIVGSWDATQGIAQLVYHFEDNGVFSQDVNATTPLGSLKMIVTGTYKLEEKNLTITVSKIGKIEAPNKAIETKAREMAEAQISKPIIATVEFKGDDEMTLSQNGQSVSLKKKK